MEPPPTKKGGASFITKRKQPFSTTMAAAMSHGYAGTLSCRITTYHRAIIVLFAVAEMKTLFREDFITLSFLPSRSKWIVVYYFFLLFLFLDDFNIIFFFFCLFHLFFPFVVANLTKENLASACHKVYIQPELPWSSLHRLVELCFLLWRRLSAQPSVSWAYERSTAYT